MNPIVISIAEDGTSTFLVNESTTAFLDNATVRRASHVEPDGAVLRIAFHALRHLFGEKGWVSEFTRIWPVMWRVNLAPSKGPILPQRWYNRKAAIEAEIQWLNENFI